MCRTADHASLQVDCNMHGEPMAYTFTNARTNSRIRDFGRGIGNAPQATPPSHSDVALSLARFQRSPSRLCTMVPVYQTSESCRPDGLTVSHGE